MDQEPVQPIITQQPTIATTSPPPSVPPITPPSKNILALISMVSGVLALGFNLFYIYVGAALSIAAVVLGIIAIKKPKSKGLSQTGIILGSVGALIGLTFIILTLPIVTNSLNDNTQFPASAFIASKKDFVKGETAVFGPYEIKANSVDANIVTGTPDTGKKFANNTDTVQYAQITTPDTGMQFIDVNLTIKNISEESQYEPDLKMVSSGVTYKSLVRNLPAENLLPGDSVTGDIRYSVKEGAKNLKLQLTIENVFAGENESRQRLTWTLVL